MAQNADGTEIVTMEQARKYMQANDCVELRDDIMHVLNVRRVDIDADGDVYVRGPGGDFWLDEARMIDTIGRIEAGV